MILGGCGWFQSKQPDAGAGPQTTRERLANQARLQRTCASTATYDRLKVAMFEKAAQIRGGRANALDSLEAASIVRMENPIVKGRNDTLNVTVCAGRFVLELPEGAARAFGGDRRLKADIEYSAQQAVDNSGLVYQMQGAEPIVYRLSTLGMGQQASRAPLPPPVVPRVDDAPVPARVDAPPSAMPPARQVSRPFPQPRRPVIVVDQAAPEPPTPEPPTRVTIPRVSRDIVAPRPRDRIIEQRPRVAQARPSFNCANARLRVETAVCSSDRLAAADRAMSGTYFRAVAQADPETRSRLSASRARFLAYRNRCGDDECIAQAYADRIDEIEDLAGGR